MDIWSDVCVLTTIRILPSVRRAHQPCRIHLPPVQVLVRKLIAVYADSTGPIALGYVTTLYHELVNDSVKRRFCVKESIVLACAQLAEAVVSECQQVGAWRVTQDIYFSHVLGVLSTKSSTASLPAGSSPMLTSRNARGRCTEVMLE